MNPATLFVSHISEEAEVAALLKEFIEKDFIRIVELFASSDIEGIRGGEKWLDVIQQRIADSAAVLVLCSHASVLRPWVQFEIGAAWISGKPIIPVCHSGMKLTELPMPLSSLQGLELGIEKGLQKLNGAIASAIKIAEAPPVQDLASRLERLQALKRPPPPVEQFERYINIVLPSPAKLDGPTIPDDAIIESNTDSLRIFELTVEGARTWADIVAAARQTSDQRWLEQLQQCVHLASQNRTFRSVQAIYHSRSTGSYQPQLSRKEALPDGGSRFHVHLVETTVAPLIDVPNEFGLLATVLRLGLRFRFEVIVPCSKLLVAVPRSRTSPKDAQEAVARLRMAVETIERDAMSRGAQNIDTPSIIEIFEDDADKHTIAEISEKWEIARVKLFSDDVPLTFDELRKVMDDMRDINYTFMKVGTRRYHEMVSSRWQPKPSANGAPAAVTSAAPVAAAELVA